MLQHVMAYASRAGMSLHADMLMKIVFSEASAVLRGRGAS